MGIAVDRAGVGLGRSGWAAEVAIKRIFDGSPPRGWRFCGRDSGGYDSSWCFDFVMVAAVVPLW